MTASIISSAAKLSKEEARNLAMNHEASKAEAASMVGISKEFINTYIETGRKLPLGGREKSNISIAKKVKEERVGNSPRKVGVNADGTDKYENTPSAPIPEHGSLRVYSSCPSWVK